MENTITMELLSTYTISEIDNLSNMLTAIINDLSNNNGFCRETQIGRLNGIIHFINDANNVRYISMLGDLDLYLNRTHVLVGLLDSIVNLGGNAYASWFIYMVFLPFFWKNF